ncbi:MAG: hypothetical protein OXH65_02955 [Paracoccaceae bacterium]|nr:hypothetical protein [Paracoccaceae bacterium]
MNEACPTNDPQTAHKRPTKCLNGLLVVVLAFLLVHSMAIPSLGQNGLHSPPDEGWVRNILADYRCDPEVADHLARSTRLGVEREVRRGEQAIKPPTSVGELSCLGTLMKSPGLDLLYPTGSISPANLLIGVLTQLQGNTSTNPFGSIDLDALAGGGFDPTRVISNSLCSLARDRWNQQTIPLIGDFARLGVRGLARPPPQTGNDQQSIQHILQTGN